MSCTADGRRVGETKRVVEGRDGDGDDAEAPSVSGRRWWPLPKTDAHSAHPPQLPLDFSVEK